MGQSPNLQGSLAACGLSGLPLPFSFFEVVEQLPKVLDFSGRKAASLDQCLDERRGRTLAKLVGQLFESLPQEMVARHERAKDMPWRSCRFRRTPWIQACKRVNTVVWAQLRSGDWSQRLICHGARPVVPQGLQDIELGFAGW